ncbi:MAG: PP2C family protein-serine/threonine phosphatase [Phototrophicaceae bacterium]
MQALTRELKLMGQAWHNIGAEALVILRQDEVLASFPSDYHYQPEEIASMIKAPWQINHELVLLCAVGIDSVAMQARLFADASLLTAIIKREFDIMQLSNEVMEYQDRLITLYELNESLQYQTKLQHILHILAEKTQHLLKVYHTFVVLNPLTDKPEVAQAGAGYVPNELINTWFTEINDDKQYKLLTSSLKKTSQVMLMPIEIGNDVIGILGVIRKTDNFTMPEIKMVRSISEQASTHIQKAFLIQERLQQERISVEMNVARNVQMSLLADSPENIDGLDVWAYCNPALEVGGDFYEFKQHGQSFRFALGDVAGKGISAALLMAMSRTVLKVLREPTPKSVIEQFNEHLYDDFSKVNSFVTLFLGYYDLALHQLSYANAGHSPVIYCPSEGKSRILEADSPPIGVLRETMLGNHTIQMGLSDVLVVSSDGIPEAPQLSGTMLGYQDMLDLIETYRHKSAKEIGQVLLQAANIHYMPDDDQTLLIIKRVS